MENLQIEKISITEEDINSDIVDIICSNGTMSIDIETTGLDWANDSLATIQIYSGNEAVILKTRDKNLYPANLLNLFEDPAIQKVFHHAMFDMRFITYEWDNGFKNVVCTKVASKLLNKTSNDHSLKTLLNNYLNIDIEKDMWDSNWLDQNLTQDQIRYALNDVIYLPRLFSVLSSEIQNSELTQLAQGCYDFIPHNVWLQVHGYEGVFEH